MRTPAFWNDKNLLSTLLLPLTLFYRLGHAIRQTCSKATALPVPVICVGNLTAGGSGKTPVALAIGQSYKQKNIAACFLSRGYGGSLRGPLLVDPARHDSLQVGDEPLLLARMLPTIVAKNRIAGARLAVSQGAKIIIMDDGLQNSSIVKDLSLLVVDGQTGFGNSRLLPAGPLRETVRAGFNNAQAIIVINGERLLPLPEDKPILRARTAPADTATLRDKKLLAFCGIAYPQKFFGMLQANGAQLTECVAFADHHPYRESELKALLQKAAAAGAQLATTAKDAVRLPGALRAQILIVDMTLTFEDAHALDLMLSSIDGKN